MNFNSETSQSRQATVNGLAVVGFITIIALGVWLALYSTRFVPTVVNGFGTAAVYLGSLFTPSPNTGLSVVPTPSASTTIPFGDATTTDTTPKPTPKPKPTTSGTKPTVTSPSITLYGLPDLAITETVRGYFATKNSPESFVQSATVPAGEQPAVRFIVTNVGTNVSGIWRFTTDIPVDNSPREVGGIDCVQGTNSERLICTSSSQQSLGPGDSIDYKLGFNADKGSNQYMTITLDPQNAINESVKTNNTITLKIDVL